MQFNIIPVSLAPGLQIQIYKFNHSQSNYRKCIHGKVKTCKISIMVYNIICSLILAVERDEYWYYHVRERDLKNKNIYMDDFRINRTFYHNNQTPYFELFLLLLSIFLSTSWLASAAREISSQYILGSSIL